VPVHCAADLRCLRDRRRSRCTAGSVRDGREELHSEAGDDGAGGLGVGERGRRVPAGRRRTRARTPRSAPGDSCSEMVRRVPSPGAGAGWGDSMGLSVGVVAVVRRRLVWGGGGGGRRRVGAARASMSARSAPAASRDALTRRPRRRACPAAEPREQAGGAAAGIRVRSSAASRT
jgi:hypothetical protein